MLYEEGILSVVLRTVISCGRDEYGAVEKTLKGILTICTLLVFTVDVALWWTIYIGVKRFHCGGSVVPAMPSASGIRVFTMKLRGLLHQSAKSCCQVARSCFKGILRAHRHSLFSFTFQMLAQSDFLKYWFAETARYQNGQGSTASCQFSLVGLKRILDQNLSSGSTLVTLITTHFFQFRFADVAHCRHTSWTSTLTFKGDVCC